MQRVRVSSHQAPVHKLGDSQMTLSPKFRLAAMPSALLDPSLELELSLKGEPLIPGLPDDVALNCLLRVPVDNHAACRAVCKRWYSLFGSKERFFTRRKELGFHDPWLFVFAFHKCTGKIQWQVLDLNQFTWHTIPAMPCKDKVCPRGFRCVSMPNEGVLFVCGGVVSDVDCPLNLVLKYEIRKNRWTVMKKMITARSFFASGVIDGMIYVAGGNSSDLFELNSAEVLDPSKGTWQPVASMGTNMASYDTAVLNGKLLVTEGWFWPFYVVPRGQIYDPKTDNWESMATGLREGWTGSSVVVYGHLFVVSEHERTKLKVYDTENDSWETVDGPPLPEQICKPFSVNCCDCRIFVVGRNLHVAVGHISQLYPRSTSEKRSCFSVQWQVIDAPDSLSDLTPSSAQKGHHYIIQNCLPICVSRLRILLDGSALHMTKVSKLCGAAVFSLHWDLQEAFCILHFSHGNFFGNITITFQAEILYSNTQNKKQQDQEQNALNLSELGPIKTLLCGAISDASLEAAIYPFEVVKRQNLTTSSI